MLELNLENLPIVKLKAMAASILSENEHWKDCNDGSYGMALHNSPYYKILEEIKRSEDVQMELDL
tara:strand:+ start:519 stop:713 length:195 start_codon:yes stop_codon:yes gene_type:complete